jgi:hypothetical protein
VLCGLHSVCLIAFKRAPHPCDTIPWKQVDCASVAPVASPFNIPFINVVLGALLKPHQTRRRESLKML